MDPMRHPADVPWAALAARFAGMRTAMVQRYVARGMSEDAAQALVDDLIAACVRGQHDKDE